MSDGISFIFNKSGFDRQIANLLKATPGARDRAVAAAGEAGARAGRMAAPVLTGRLRDSITSRTGRDGSANVGPRGDPVYLYAKKEEARKAYMEAARAAAEAAIGPAFEAEMRKIGA